MPISGTMLAATMAMRRMPPMITAPSRTDSTSPDAQVGIPKEASRPDAMLFDCGRLPEPKELIIRATAKNTASHFMFRPRSM